MIQIESLMGTSGNSLLAQRRCRPLLRGGEFIKSFADSQSRPTTNFIWRIVTGGSLNWPRDPAQFRISGGPSNTKHRHGAGLTPRNQDVTIRWVVELDRQRSYVNNDLRFDDWGDFSRLDNAVSVFCYKSKVKVKVKSIRVRPLAGPSKQPSRSGFTR